MAPDDARWAAAFPALYADSYVDYADCWIGFTTGAVPDELVARLHLVARTPQGHVIACRSAQGWRFLPGGTREEGEALDHLASRELMEEAGARTTGKVALFGAHIADSLRDAPYRPHLPHPRAYWAYGFVQAELVGPPSNPCDGEQVVEVLALPPADAAGYIEQHDPLQAAVVRLAQAMALV